jgi:hypothetical protein
MALAWRRFGAGLLRLLLLPPVATPVDGATSVDGACVSRVNASRQCSLLVGSALRLTGAPMAGQHSINMRCLGAPAHWSAARQAHCTTLTATPEPIPRVRELRCPRGQVLATRARHWLRALHQPAQCLLASGTVPAHRRSCCTEQRFHHQCQQRAQQVDDHVDPPLHVPGLRANGRADGQLQLVAGFFLIFMCPPAP